MSRSRGRSPGTLFSRRKHWAHRFGTAPLLPMTPEELQALGWDACDVVLVTGDAYVDHPAFGMALIGRVLEAQGFRVGIIAQPDWRAAADFARLGRPAVMFGVTSGNMDSMVNRYTADRRPRSDDAYSPGGAPDRRPDRAVLVYAHRCREAFPDVPIVLGGVEASLRRLAHYDYWSDTVRRSALLDAKADLLVYGSGERPVLEIAHRLAAGEPVAALTDVRGTALIRPAGAPLSEAFDAQQRDAPRSGHGDAAAAIRLPSFEAVRRDRLRYAHAARVALGENNAASARALVQRSGSQDVWVNPPAPPLSTAELDAVYELPFARRPHPGYAGQRIQAEEMIRTSVTILRGCFGGCTFCSLAAHEGRTVQSRSAESVLREIEVIRDRVPGFTGVISDLGGPTANMYRMGCARAETAARCRRASCLYPKPCRNLRADHGPLIALYRGARALPGVKKVLVASGVRYDLAVSSPEYVRELAQHHVGGYLKIAPEHTEPGPLHAMGKPQIAAYERFAELFARCSTEAGKEQYLIPYFIAAHPGTADADMLALALWLKRHRFRLDQVQTFLPAPMAVATTMYHTGRDPRLPLRADDAELVVPRGARQRRLHKAFLRYHDPESWPLLRAALRAMQREELVGPGKRCLVPAWSRHRPGR